MYNKLDILINKDNPIDKFYIPEDLIILDDNENNFHNYINPNNKPMVRRIMLNDLLELQNNALCNGFNYIVDSGYRSYEYQQDILDFYINKIGYDVAIKRVALPGTSEHQSGLAIDFRTILNGILNEEMTKEELDWLFYNASLYGFILRYPLGKENITSYNFEPWHYRYIGKELAAIITTSNLTLEEYHSNKLVLTKK